MSKYVLIVILGLAATGGGVGLIVAADHYGWIRGGGSEGAKAGGELCRHEAPASRCPFCNPDLIESMGWCASHGVAEALCTRCSAGIIPAFKVEGDWCAEHGLPESQCTLCGAGGAGQIELASADSSRAGRDTLRAERAPSKTCTTAYTTVTLKSPEVARRAGLQVESVQTETITESVTCSAEVAFDGRRYANLSTRAPGIVTEVRVDLGDEVASADVLAVIDSSELGSAKAALLQAHSLVDLWQKNLEREQGLIEQNAGTQKDVLEAETSLVESRVQLSSATQRLKNLGLSESDIARVLETHDTSSHLPLRSPLAGIVVQRNAVPGEVVSISQPLFAVADTSAMWVMLDVYEGDVMRLHKGQKVTITIDAMPDRPFEGELTWISAQVNHQTRTIQARAEVENPGGMLRANMFGRANVHVRTIENAVLVPESAVQWEGCCNVVFVRHTDTVYQPYKVTLGYKHNGRYVVEDGLPAGESVVTQGSYLLKTEILKGNIGAGCCEIDPGKNR